MMKTFLQFFTEQTENTTALDENVFNIPHYNWDWLVNKVNILNRRATKLGVPPLVINVIEEFEVTNTKDEYGNKIDPPEIIKYKKTKLDGQGPIIPGWRLLAVINHEAGTPQNIIDKVPTEVVAIPKSYWTAKPDCDHCQHSRYRRQTFLIQNTETGEIKQIGRTCLKDFLGHSPEKFLNYASWIRNVGLIFSDAEGSEFLGKGSREQFVPLKAFLKHVAHFANEYGYISRRVAEERNQSSTKDLAIENMFPNPMLRIKPEKTTEKDEELADATIKWVKKFTDDEANIVNSNLPDFWRNLKAIYNAGSVSSKTYGYAAAGVGMYLRERDKEKIAAKTKKKPSNHVGNVGEKVDLTVTVLSSRPVETMYGTSTLYNMEDSNGNSVKWFSSGYKTVLDDGQTYNIRATVKKHDEYKGKKQTLVNRLKIV